MAPCPPLQKPSRGRAALRCCDSGLWGHQCPRGTQHFGHVQLRASGPWPALWLQKLPPLSTGLWRARGLLPRPERAPRSSCTCGSSCPVFCGPVGPGAGSQVAHPPCALPHFQRQRGDTPLLRLPEARDLTRARHAHTEGQSSPHVCCPSPDRRPPEQSVRLCLRQRGPERLAGGWALPGGVIGQPCMSVPRPGPGVEGAVGQERTLPSPAARQAPTCRGSWGRTPSADTRCHWCGGRGRRAPALLSQELSREKQKPGGLGQGQGAGAHGHSQPGGQQGGALAGQVSWRHWPLLWGHGEGKSRPTTVLRGQAWLQRRVWRSVWAHWGRAQTLRGATRDRNMEGERQKASGSRGLGRGFGAFPAWTPRPLGLHRGLRHRPHQQQPGTA